MRFIAKEWTGVRFLAPLKHTDEQRERLLIGVDRKWQAYGQNGTIDPIRTSAAPSSGEEIYYACLQIVHRTSDFNVTIRLHCGQHCAVLENVGHRNFDILPGDGVNK
jgi:hypothetical protein